MQMVAVFIVAFLAEMCAAGYTLGVARGQWRLAVICSGLLALINAGILLSIVADHTLLMPSVAGEVCGTAAMMRLTMRVK